MDRQVQKVLRIYAVVLLMLITATGFCQSTDPELNRTIDIFYASIESGDPEPRIALLAHDVIMMPNHWTLIGLKNCIITELDTEQRQRDYCQFLSLRTG